MALTLGARPSRRTLFLALALAAATLGATGTFAASYFPATNQFTGSNFQTNVLTGDPTGFTATNVANSNVVGLQWTDPASTNFGNGDAELVQWSSSAHTCPTAATAYTLKTGSAWAAGSSHTPTDTVDPSGSGSNTPAGAFVCYGASVAYSATNPSPTTWTSSTVAWFGFSPGVTPIATRYGEYVGSIALSNTGLIQKSDTITISYSQSTNQPALGGGLNACIHQDTGSGMTIVFLGYSGATCSYTPATASTAPTQFGYVVQTAGTTSAFADQTATIAASWPSATQLVVAVTHKLSTNVTETGTAWAYHVSATAPAGATQVVSSGSGSLVAENASSPLATSATGW